MIISLASINFMYWYHDQGGSSPRRILSCAQSRTWLSFCFMALD